MYIISVLWFPQELNAQKTRPKESSLFFNKEIILIVNILAKQTNSNSIAMKFKRLTAI